MKTLRFKNKTGTLKVDFITDIIGDHKGQFQVLQVQGASEAEKRTGLNFQLLDYDYFAFKAYAQNNNLMFQEVTNDDVTTIVDDSGITDLAITNSDPLTAGTIARKEETSIICRADSSGDLNDTYWTLNSALDAIGYYVWYNVNSAGTDPEVEGKTGIEVAVVTDAADTAVANATQAAIDAIDDFDATVDTATVTVINAATGDTTDSADSVGAATSFTIAEETAGVTVTTYREKLTVEGGNGSDFVYSVNTGDLPDGVELFPDGRLIGTATVADTFTVTYEVTDGFETATKELDIVIS